MNIDTLLYLIALAWMTLIGVTLLVANYYDALDGDSVTVKHISIWLFCSLIPGLNLICALLTVVLVLSVTMVAIGAYFEDFFNYKLPKKKTE